MGNSTSALTHFIPKWREHGIVQWLYMTVISTFGAGAGDLRGRRIKSSRSSLVI